MRTAEGGMNVNLLRKTDCGVDILGFAIGRLVFDWFTCDGEWFVYVHIFRRRKMHLLRLSSAGNYFETHKRTG